MSATLNITQQDRSRFAAKLFKHSFEEFVFEFWDTIVAEPLIWNWHMSLMCSELQYVAERVFQRKKKKHDLVINVPPGSSKSTICSIFFPAWTWTRDASMRHICGSHTFDLTLDLSRKTRMVLESEKWLATFPEIKLDEGQNTKEYFATTEMGFRKSVTVGGKSPTGFHAHFLVVDDPIDPQKSLSDAEIKKANDWMTGTLPSRKVDKSIAVTVLIMQRLHQNDPTGMMLEKEPDRKKLRWICLPADSDEYEVYPRTLKRNYTDGLLDPNRMPRRVLAEQLRDLGAAEYAGQYGQHPIPRGGGMFKVSRFGVDMMPSIRKFTRLVRYWDKAGTHKGGAFTVGVLMGQETNGRIWVLDVVRGQWGPEEREAIIKQTAMIDGRSVVIGMEQEPGSAGKDSVQASIRNLVGFRVKADPPTGDKTLRAEPFATQVNGYNVWLVNAPWNRKYTEEFQYFPASTYKDQVDASSGCFKLLSEVPRRVGAL